MRDEICLITGLFAFLLRLKSAIIDEVWEFFQIYGIIRQLLFRKFRIVVKVFVTLSQIGEREV